VPRVMSLKEVLREWLDHRKEVLVRRTNFRLGEIARRLEILEGYLIAYLNLDEVIRIIRTEDEPKPALIEALQAHGHPGRSHPQHAPALPCASWKKWKSAARTKS
jgi:DNA gyrase/topoisomerase IV subunit A